MARVSCLETVSAAMRTHEVSLGVQLRAADALAALVATAERAARARELGAGHSLVLAMRVHGASERLQERGCDLLARMLEGSRETDDLKVASVESAVDAMARFGGAAAVQLAAARLLATVCEGDTIAQTHAASCGAVEGTAGAMAVRLSGHARLRGHYTLILFFSFKPRDPQSSVVSKHR